MQWLKTWLMKWLGVNELRAENSELIQRLDLIVAEVRHLSDSVGMNAQSVFKYREILDRLVKATDAATNAIDSRFDKATAELIEIVKMGERDDKRISELETCAKDSTLDTALAAIEDRVAKLEAAPAPGPQGRRGGSAWNAHQVAASAGAARANGADIPIPTPGVS